MESLSLIFTIVLLILSVVMIAVGVYTILVLLEARRTLRKLNHAIDSFESKWAGVLQPLQNLGGLASGLGSGIKVFETFVGWLQRETPKK